MADKPISCHLLGLPNGDGGNIFETKITESSKDIHIRGEKGKAHNGLPDKFKLQVKLAISITIQPGLSNTAGRANSPVLPGCSFCGAAVREYYESISCLHTRSKKQR